ncbi:MAG: pseudouridine synthase [Burkholderiaceae bacterium]|nr:pseudouridine synthase [Burkholderiaceae bacterium]MCP5218268.1 pseudouridine synthase [Burkholderiaceae bacterium]
MSRRAGALDLPLREGVAASTVAVPAGAWPTVLDFLAERLPALSRADWHARLAGGEVLDEAGQRLDPHAPCPHGRRLHYWRWHAQEPALPWHETIVFQDEWLVVADKPHFMPVTPSGRFARQSLLARLRQRLGLPRLSPVHRIDRDTAGLVLLAVQPHTRDAYQALFRARAVHKHYEAVAAHRPDLALPRRHASRLEPDPERFFIGREVPGEPNSVSELACAQVLGRHALYHLRSITGQRHQLRLHMAALGRPILGDAFYPEVRHAAGVDDWQRPLQLLARALAFTDPVTGQARAFQSSLQLAAAQGRWPLAGG